MNAPPPTFDVDLDDLERACRDVRAAVCGLRRPRWFRTGILLARLRERGDLPEWASPRFPVPRRAAIGRRMAMAALQDLFGMAHRSIVRSDRPDGAWSRLGSPERVILDPLSNASDTESAELVTLIGVDPQSPSSGVPRDAAIQVPIDDRCLWWNDDGAACTCAGRKVVEFNLVNDFGQQQGVVSAYPEDELKQLSDPFLRDVLIAARRDCPHRVEAPPTVKASHVCDQNGLACAAKGAGQKGTGGPKALLSRQEGSKGPGPVMLAPGGIEILAAEATGAGAAVPPKALDLARIVNWAKRSPDASHGPRILARFGELGQLIGHRVVQQTLA